MGKLVFFDLEVNGKGRIVDIGAVSDTNETFHSSQIGEFLEFIGGCEYLCGHNIVEHDYKYLAPFLKKTPFLIDTLYLSPIFFPKNPYHRLVKDDKIDTDELNNPLNDSLKSQSLFYDELNAFNSLPENYRKLYSELLSKDNHFEGFFRYVNYNPSIFRLFSQFGSNNVTEILDGKICGNAGIKEFIKNNPVELAYACALIDINDRYSITPAWVLCNYPEVERIIRNLRNKPCNDPACQYCRRNFDARLALKRWFGYDEFRKFDGQSLQEDSVDAAIQGRSLLAIFPTGGGKSLTFQLPALIAGETSRALTVVISPLQSLMKDQVENLERKGINDAVYINGLLSGIERAEALERLRNGKASLLYIAPEQLRSNTIEKVLMSRTIARFVIDEAHCFSAWGQDFRVEYMYIGEFINEFQKKKGAHVQIPVSCFTATAKPKVISDIKEYFFKTNNLILDSYTTDSTRTNLRYTVLYRENNKEKYNQIRDLLEERHCPTIIYVSRTRTAEEIAGQLTEDGFSAKAFHGQMDKEVKIRNQEGFMNNEFQVIVATSAFGMGVDKSDVGLVIHYEISDSLENYIQEAGRAGRDVNTEAECYVLYNDDDLNKHFILLNQTKLTISEINQVWKAVKSLTQYRTIVRISALEIARKAGWEEMSDVETKVKSALAALENAGMVKRGKNSPRIFATSIVPRNLDEALKILDSSIEMTEEDKVNSIRIIKSLISQRSRSNAGAADAESRVDYLSDILGIEISKVVNLIEKMRGIGLLKNDDDMTAFLRKSNSSTLETFGKVENLLVEFMTERRQTLDIKTFNEFAIEKGFRQSGLKHIKTVLFVWEIRNYIERERISPDKDHINIRLNLSKDKLAEIIARRLDVCKIIVNHLSTITPERVSDNYSTVNFSVTSLREAVNANSGLFEKPVEIADIQEALLYLSKTGIITIEGGFMVLYNKLQIERLADNRLKYKKEDYQNLNEFYKQRIQQIHIVGEYANLMVRDYGKAMEFVKDYFKLEFKAFIKKYFDSKREVEIGRSISKRKHDEIFGSLTPTQKAIIDDDRSRFIVVPAGPGSGKTYVLVRKLASLILMEEVKSEKLLMLTFSRSAASEFKNRLFELIGNAAKYVEIKTFHSYCFDLIGQKGSLEKSEDVVKTAVGYIRDGKVEKSFITKSILVIDEAQDMSADEFSLVEELIRKNEDLRIVAVGDDDQNIYEFRGSDSRYMKVLIDKYNASVYNMVENFRSGKNIIATANDYSKCIRSRLKHTEIQATKPFAGKVNLIGHAEDNYQEAIVNEVIASSASGRKCVLTYRNDDALIISALLNHNGIKAKLIQSNDGFRLSKLVELHYFIGKIKDSCRTIKIDPEIWRQAKDETFEKFADSRNLPLIKNCLSCFENEYGGTAAVGSRYVSDFDNFIDESSLEDFYTDGEDEVIVSTIHKAKGKEWDNVFISLKGLDRIGEAEKRAIFVGLTRAKNNLSVHYSGNTFSYTRWSAAQMFRDNNVYGEPKEILLQLGHKDLVLSFFKDKEATVGQLHAGQELYLWNEYLKVHQRGMDCFVAKFSERSRKQIADIISKGYQPYRTHIRFIVYWNSQDENENWFEVPIVLPDILFRKG